MLDKIRPDPEYQEGETFIDENERKEQRIDDDNIEDSPGDGSKTSTPPDGNSQHNSGTPDDPPNDEENPPYGKYNW